MRASLSISSIVTIFDRANLGFPGSYAGTFDPSEGYREAEHNFEME